MFLRLAHGAPREPRFSLLWNCKMLAGWAGLFCLSFWGHEKGGPAGQQRCLLATRSGVKMSRKWTPRPGVAWGAHCPSWVSHR